MQNCTFSFEDKFIYPFDMNCLFTCLLSQQTIGALIFCMRLICLQILLVFLKPPLLSSQTMSVEFSFDNKQANRRIAMVSLLGPTGANICSFYEQDFLTRIIELVCQIYRWYFCVFDNDVGVGIFHESVNSLSEDLSFTCGKLMFFFPSWMSCYTERIQNSSHQCTRKPISRAYIADKIPFVQESKVNGNPLDILDACFREKILQFVKSTSTGSQNCPAHLSISSIGIMNIRFAKQISVSANNCYFCQSI